MSSTRMSNYFAALDDGAGSNNKWKTFKASSPTYQHSFFIGYM